MHLFLWCVVVASQPVPPTPLHAASERGDVAEVRRLLAQSPASVDDLEDAYLRTPLMVAVTRRRESVTRLLLAANASLEMRDRDAQTALALASQAGLVQIVQLLLERGALVNGLWLTRAAARYSTRRGRATLRSSPSSSRPVPIPTCPRGPARLRWSRLCSSRSTSPTVSTIIRSTRCCRCCSTRAASAPTSGARWTR